MRLRTTQYVNYEQHLPQKGQHILAQQDKDTLIVYQAFNPPIAKYAIAHQSFGGSHYKYTRMSWIKPNFLWMMYRCGWASKINQERVLAICLRKSTFEDILSQGVHTSFQATLYKDPNEWKAALKKSNVRLQWDPDHGPRGQKLNRRAIQIGMAGTTLFNFGKKWILSIEDITDFVIEEGKKLSSNASNLRVMEESVYSLSDESLVRRLGVDAYPTD